MIPAAGASSLRRVDYPEAAPTPKIPRQEEPKPQPPVAKRSEEPTVHTAHGDERHDYYHWMRQKDDDSDFIPFLESWNTYTARSLERIATFTDKLNHEICSRVERDFDTVPFKVGHYLYYKRHEGKNEYPIHYRRPVAGGPEEEVLNSNELSKKHTYFKIKSYFPSEDGQYVAFSIDNTGSQYGSIHVKDMKTGNIHFNEAIPFTSNDFVWNSHSTGFWYVQIDDVTRPNKVAFHYVGTPIDDDKVYYHEQDELYEVAIQSDLLNRHLFVTSRSKDTSEVSCCSLDHPGMPFYVIQPRKEGLRYFIVPGDEYHYFLVNNGRENTSLYRSSSLTHRFAEWVQMEPSKPDQDFDNVALFRKHIVIQKRVQGLTKFEVRNLETGRAHYIPLPQELCTASFYNILDFDSHCIQFKFHSPITPSSVFEYDMRAERLRLLRQNKAGGFNPSEYHMERIWATAPDGVKVPITLFHKKGLVRDGSVPLRMVGYGAYGITTDPYFSNITASYLERGVTCAIAHVRGSGDLGYSWYQDGYMLKKMNTFTDFIACAEHLIQQGYTSPDKFAIQGGSAGGLLMGAVIGRRPDLFKACIMEVPFVDVITTMFDETIPLTKEEWKEWGNPNEKEYYNLMKTYSPYDNIPIDQTQAVITVPPAEPPALFIKAGLNDEQVPVWEAAKFTAKMERFKRLYNLNRNPLYLYTNMQAGHHGDPGRFSGYKELAPMHAFVLDQLGFKQ